MKGLNKVLFKKICGVYFVAMVVIMAIFLFFNLALSEASPGSLAADYLIEIGKYSYTQGNYTEALKEFKKVLLLDPYHKEALYYIKLIEGVKEIPLQEIPISEEERHYQEEEKKKAIEEILSKIEREKEQERKKKAEAVTVVPEEKIGPTLVPVPVKEIETEEGKSVTVTPVPAIEIEAERKKKGDISLFIDEKEVSIEKPILVVEGKILVPLREIASKFYFSTIDLREGNFRLISPDGTTKEIKTTLRGGEPLLTEEQLKELFSVESYFDEGKKMFYIRTKLSPQFQVYAQEKPKEVIEQEKAMEEIVRKATLTPEKPTTIPEAAKPSLQLKGNTSYTMIDYHISPTYHSLVSSLAGRVYDFNLQYQTSWKDINGVFDHDYTYLNLTQPGLFIGLFDQSIGLFPLRLQSQSFNGLKIIKDWEEINRTTVVGGKTENTVSDTSGSVKYLGRIYGLTEEFLPLNWLGLKGGLLYSENWTDISDLSGTTSFPRSNLISFAQTTLKLPYDLTVSTQLAHCGYEPDNAPETFVQDWDWRIGSEINKERYKLGAAYEFVGDRYVSLGNPAFYQDYSGWNLYGNYKVTDNWSLSSNVMGYHNNVDDDYDKVTTDNLSYSLSSYYRLPKEQWVNLSFSRFLSDPYGPDSGESSDSGIYRIDYSFPFYFDIRPTLNYQYYRTDSSSGESDYYAHSPGATLFKSFGKGSSWYLSQQFTKTLYKTSADNMNSNTSFNINYVINSLFSLYHNYSYNRDKSSQSTATNTISESTGFKFRLLPETTLNMEHRVNSYNLKTEKGRWPRDWSIMVYVSQGFGFSTPPNFGTIEGWVFRDINANGRMDYGEPGVAEVRLYLEDKRETTTRRSGYFNFSYITPGRQKVYLDVASLPTQLTLPKDSQEVEVKPRRANKVNFALVEASSIKGKVFIDANLDNIFQKTEEPLDNVAVILLPVEQFRRTNSEGDFEFSYLLPGKYKVRINPEDIPTGYELASQGELEIELSAGREVKGINFVVYLKTARIEKF